MGNDTSKKDFRSLIFCFESNEINQDEIEEFERVEQFIEKEYKKSINLDNTTEESILITGPKFESLNNDQDYFEKSYYNYFNRKHNVSSNGNTKLIKNNYKQFLNIQYKIQNSFENQNILKVSKINQIPFEQYENEPNTLTELLKAQTDVIIEYEKSHFNMTQYFNKVPNPDLYKIILILIDIASGIKAMHSNQVAHCNLQLEYLVNTDSGWKISTLQDSFHLDDIQSDTLLKLKKLNIISESSQIKDNIDKMCYAKDTFDFGMILFYLITKVYIPNEKESNYSLSNFYKDNSKFLSLLINKFNKNYRDKFFKKEFQSILLYIFAKCTDSNPSKRISIDYILTILIKILENYE